MQRLNLQLEQTPESDYIKGAIDGDGHLTDRHTILEVVSKEFAMKFKRQIELWSGHCAGISTKTYPSGKTAYRVTLSSKDVVEFFNSCNSVKYPSFYLSGVFDSEGTIYQSKWRKNIAVSNMNEELIREWKSLFEELGIHCSLYKTTAPNGKPYFKLHISVKEDNVKRFADNIVISVLHRRERLKNQWRWLIS